MKPGVGLTNTIGGGLITEGLTAIAAWLLPVAILVDAFVLDAQTICATDPPPMPTFDSSDLPILALGLLAPNAQVTLGKIHDALSNWLWPQYCKCDNNQVPPPVAIPPPQGTTSPTSNSSAPCFTGAYTGLAPVTPSATFPSGWQDVTEALLPVNGQTHTLTDSGGSYPIYGIPAGVTSVSYVGQLPSSTGLGCSGDWALCNISTYNSVGTLLANHDMTIGNSLPNCGIQWNFPLESGAVYWRGVSILHTGNYGTIIGQLSYSTQVWCGAGGPGVSLNCCPPDPSIQIALQNILQLIQNLGGSAPPAYHLGTVHSGLTGTGTITVKGIFGVKFALTTGVPTAIQFPGVPPYERSVGWCSILTGDGMIDETRITRQNQVWASALAPYATTIGYQLNAGFSMDLTELLPG